MLQLAELVKEVVTPRLPEGAPAPTIVYRENTKDDPKQRKPDITRAQTLLGWSPKIPLRDGLGLMITDFKTRLGLD